MRPASKVGRKKPLDKLEARVANVHVPLAYADQLYALRSHIELVRARLAPR